MPTDKNDIEVSPNNPCPFLRASVQQGLLNDDVASIGEVTDTVLRVSKAGSESPNLPSLAIRAIALIANGLGPITIAKSAFRGVRLDALRNGPLDKKGAGSRILDTHGLVSETELNRLAQFASDKKAADETLEPGLDAADLTRFMDENFARAEGHRRGIDRKLMNGEWPALLNLMGKEGQDGRYISIAEVRNLFLNRIFPERMMMKLRAAE